MTYSQINQKVLPFSKGMKNAGLVLLGFTLLCGCSNSNDKQANAKNNHSLVAYTNVSMEELSPVNRATYEYYTITRKDTSWFRPKFHISLKDSSVKSISFNSKYNEKNKTFEEKLLELKIILSAVEQYFTLDSLKHISVGRLISTGKYAIDFTTFYQENQKKQNSGQHEQYEEVRHFLVKSSLARDINQVFKPYSRVISDVGIEKVHYFENHQLLDYCKIRKDTQAIPPQILDCSVWFTLK